MRPHAASAFASAILVLGALGAAPASAAGVPAQAGAPPKPATVAESSGYTATATYAEVMAFIRDIQALSPLVRVESVCVSTQGRDVPLLVVGDPPPASPAALRSDPRLPVYIQANIHAGEVEGKEAALALVRDIVLDPKKPYLDKIVLLVAPIFNADGNDRMDPANRPGQVGPEKGSGVRPNGQNLDLNRDAMKLESPEMRGLVRNVLGRWDPLVMVDCHTTDGSYHEEPVTWSWPLCPNGDPSIVGYGRDVMMPAIAATLEKTYGVLSIPYGDPVSFEDMSKGWRTFGHEPHYATNYIGLRNRLSVLDENYNYADYKTRVLGCYAFLRAILDYARNRGPEIAKLCADADRATVARGLTPPAAPDFGLAFEARPLPKPVTVRGYEVEVLPREGGGWPRVKRTDRKRTYTMPYLADFEPVRSVRAPFAYLVPLEDPAIAEAVARHGVAVERLTAPATLPVEAFRIKALKAGERPYQGHHLNTVEGEAVAETRDFPAGTLVVRTAQPLGRLASYLLEPQSDDGMMAWNAFDRYVVAQWGRGTQTCPVYKLYEPRALTTEMIEESR